MKHSISSPPLNRNVKIRPTTRESSNRHTSSDECRHAEEQLNHAMREYQDFLGFREQNNNTMSTFAGHAFLFRKVERLREIRNQIC